MLVKPEAIAWLVISACRNSAAGLQGDDPADEHRNQGVEQRDRQPGAQQGDVVPANLAQEEPVEPQQRAGRLPRHTRGGRQHAGFEKAEHESGLPAGVLLGRRLQACDGNAASKRPDNWTQEFV
jgi:hypothetical protein